MYNLRLRLSINFCYSLLQLVLVSLMFLISVILRPIVFLILKSRYGKSVRLLKPSDAFLAFEDTSSNIVMAIKCKGVPDIQDIYRRLEERTFHMPSTLELDGKQSQVPYNPYDCLKWKLVTKYFYFCWEKCPDFNFRNHFIVEKFPSVVQNGENFNLQEMCSKSTLKTKNFVKSDLDRSLERVSEYYLEHKFSSEKPGWVIHILIPKDEGGKEIRTNPKHCPEPGSGGEPKDFAMIFCAHHSYGDGMCWIQMLRHVWADVIFDLKFEPLQTPSIFKNRTVLQVILQTCISFGYTLLLPLRIASFMAMSMCESHMFSVGSPNSSRSCSWRGMEMKKIQTVRKHRRQEENNGRFAKFTTVIYSCITYAYRQFLLEADSSQNSTVIIPKVFNTTTIFADFPYKSLRPTNQTLVTSILMPVGECCRNQRFSAVGHILTKAANIFELKGTSASIKIWGSLITPFLKFIYSMDSLSCSLVVSNLLGPQESFTVLGGHEVLNILGFPPLKVKTSVSLCLVSYRDSVDVCVVADDAVTKKFPDFVSRCLHYFDEELENLVRDSLSS